jgi:hypothetical protein
MIAKTGQGSNAKKNRALSYFLVFYFLVLFLGFLFLGFDETIAHDVPKRLLLATAASLGMA